MADIISVIVVIAFLVIVFRKRLSPLLRGRKPQKNAEAVADTAVSVSEPVHKDTENIYVHVFAIDTSRYSSMHDLSDAIESKSYECLAKIYNDYGGRFVALDVITLNCELIFLIRWHTLTPERE